MILSEGEKRGLVFLFGVLYGLFLAWAFTASPANSEEICFPVPDAQRLLVDVEAGRQCLAEYKPAADNVIALQEERIVQLTEERDKATAALSNGDNACAEAVNAARGTWWERARKAGGWMGIGGIIAAVAILLL